MSEANQLLPFLNDHLENDNGFKLVPYYENIFGRYEDHLNNKYNKNEDLNAIMSLLNHYETIVEIGAGTGRLINKIKSKCDHYIAVEPTRHGCKVIEESNFENVTIYNGEFKQFSDEITQKYECIIIGSLTINLFDEDKIDELIENIDSLLVEGGSLILGVFDESAIENFKPYTGMVKDSVSIELFDDGSNGRQLVHNYMRFIPEKRLVVQNWLTEVDNKTTYIATQLERIWTLDEISEYFESWSFKMADKAKFQILGGGADGETAFMCRFEKL